MTGDYCWRTSLKKGVIYGYDHAMVESGRYTLAKLYKDAGYNTSYVGKWHLGWNWKTKSGNYGNWEDGDRWHAHEIEKQVDFTQPFDGGPLELGFDYFYGLTESLAGPPYCFVENNHTVGIPSVLKPGRPDSIGVELGGREGLMVPGWRHEDVGPILTEKALNELERLSKEQAPFMMFFSTSAPHLPCIPPDFIKGRSQAGCRGDMVCEVDWSVGSVVQKLKDLGIYDQTMIIVTSDNGAVPGDQLNIDHDPHLGSDKHKNIPIWTGKYKVPTQTYGHKANGPYRDYKTSIWDGGTRIPFIIKWNEQLNKGTASSAFFSLIDFFRTFSNLFGIKLPEDVAVDSFNALPYFLGEATAEKSRDHLVTSDYFGQYAVEKDGWKLIAFDTENDLENRTNELYDLNSDPEQMHNCIDQNREKADSLLGLLDRIKTNNKSFVQG